jgi:hypothetical protein
MGFFSWLKIRIYWLSFLGLTQKEILMVQGPTNGLVQKIFVIRMMMGFLSWKK